MSGFVVSGSATKTILKRVSNSRQAFVDQRERERARDKAAVLTTQVNANIIRCYGHSPTKKTDDQLQLLGQFFVRVSMFQNVETDVVGFAAAKDKLIN